MSGLAATKRSRPERIHRPFLFTTCRAGPPAPCPHTARHNPGRFGPARPGYFFVWERPQGRVTYKGRLRFIAADVRLLHCKHDIPSDFPLIRSGAAGEFSRKSSSLRGRTRNLCCTACIVVSPPAIPWARSAAGSSGGLRRVAVAHDWHTTGDFPDAHECSCQSTAGKPAGAARSQTGGDRELAAGARVGILARSSPCPARAAARGREPAAGELATSRRRSELLTTRHRGAVGA